MYLLHQMTWQNISSLRASPVTLIKALVYALKLSLHNAEDKVPQYTFVIYIYVPHTLQIFRLYKV